MSNMAENALETTGRPCSSRSLRKRRYESTYMEGNSRKAYKVRGDIDAAQKHVMSPNNMPEQVCLSHIKEAFFGLKRQGTEIKRMKTPKNEHRPH